LQVLTGSVIASVAASALPRAALGQAPGQKWKTAIGLNGFQSGSRKYHKLPSQFDQMNGATGKPEEILLRVVVKNIGYMQFCDTDSTLRDGGMSKHLGCGDGRIDCAKSLRILKEGGFRGWMTVDEWEVPDPYDACINPQLFQARA
jgi:hypothetical protein